MTARTEQAAAGLKEAAGATANAAADALAAAKAAARLSAKARIAARAPDYWAQAGAGMARQLLSSESWRCAGTVFCFLSLADEPDTYPLLRAALAQGKRLCVPRVRRGGQMDAVLLPSLDRLVPGVLGIPTPDAALHTVLAPAEIDLAVIPCLTAAETGARLGHGGGYYDRFLAAYPHEAVLLCAEALLTPVAALPAGPLDVPVHTILTETRRILIP